MAEEMNLSDFSVDGKSLEDGATPVETPLNDNVETEAPEEVTEEVQVEETPVAESEPVEATTEESFDDAADIAQAETAEETYTPTEAPDAFNEFINSTTDGAFETYAEMEQALLDMATQLEQLSENPPQAAQEKEQYDEFLTGLIDYYKETGDVTPYLEAKSVDFDSMSDLDVVRHSLKKQYPDMSEQNFERLFNRDVINKYNLNEDLHSQDEIELGKELLKLEASKQRKSLIDEQQKFSVPTGTQQQGPSAEEQEAAVQQWRQSVEGNDFTKSVLNDRRVVVEFDGEPFAYEIDDPQSVVDMTIDNNKFFQLFQNEGGEIDYGKWYKVLNYATDPDTFERSLISHGKNLGGKEVVSEIKNPSRPTKSTSPSGGGDTKEDFLKAALRSMGR